MKNNALISVTNLKLINKFKGLGYEKFVYPLSFFCVGLPSTFEINQINEENSYLYINKALNNEDIDRLENLLNNLPSNIKGIIFEDLGLIELLKDKSIEKILYSPHFNCNFQTINYMFEYVDDIILPLDITKDDIDLIESKLDKKVSILAFGLVPSMYSRRTLITNYAKNHNLNEKNKKDLSINDNKFIAIENEFGTVIYHYPFFNGTGLINDNIHYAFYNMNMLDGDKQIELLNGQIDNIEFDYGFLDKGTIYKIRRDEK